ncbi:MAG: beta-ketoacyl-[acyl-carrier-protein] synthase II, partial [Betaproteobacteria bacterium]
MKPLLISQVSVVNSLGTGVEAMRRALCEKRSGLTPCDFETARIDTYVGTVPALDDLRVRPDLLDYDCRNNRLAQFCLEQDGFAGQVAAARDRYGAGRIGFYLGTSTSGL